MREKVQKATDHPSVEASGRAEKTAGKVANWTGRAEKAVGE